MIRIVAVAVRIMGLADWTLDGQSNKASDDCREIWRSKVLDLLMRRMRENGKRNQKLWKIGDEFFVAV